MEFTYRLTGAGWSEARLADGSSSVTLAASYVGDALGGLLKAVAALLEGAQHARCSWAQEPGESRWIFDRAGSEVRLLVLAFHHAEFPEPDDTGRAVFESAGSLREMAEAIAGGAQEVLDEYGEDGYLEVWGEHPFPVGQLELIQAHLAHK